MIRTLLTTSAIALLLAAPTIAQETTPAPAAPPVEAPAPAGAVDSGAVQTTEVNEPWDMSAGYVAADTDNLGTRLIGQKVYSAEGEEAEDIGNISDIVFDDNGQITAVVIGVGGFLGIGEKSVAVDFGALEFTLAADNTERWVLPTTAEALTAAPDFVWAEDEPVDAVIPAPADGGAMAPAPATN
jgi:hypothetical protein